MSIREEAASVEHFALQAHRLNAVLDHLPALIAYWDRDLRNVIANAAYIEWLGKTPEEMQGMHVREVLGDANYEKNLPFIAAVLAGEEQLFERTLVDPRGGVRETQASYVPDVVDGEVVGFFVLVTDVTARVDAQRAMDEAQRLADIGSWSIDVASGAIVWSEQLYRIFALDPAAKLSVEVLLEMVDPADRAAVEAQLERSRATGEAYDMTYRIHRADGEMRDVHSRGRPQRGPDGSVAWLAGTLHDVTAANAAARELSRVNTALRKVNQLNVDVIAMLGHDVRAPLSVILGYLEELSQGWDEISEDQRREFFDRAFTAASRLRTLVDNILSMASIESGQIVAQSVEMSVREQVEAVVAEIAAGADVDLISTGDPVAVADPFHVRQVISNLVTNAQRYGAAPIEIHIADRGSDTVTVTVVDHGRGVAASQVDSLFDRFVAHGAPDPSAGPSGSSGFGLYMARGLAVASGGTLEYDATGPGASFCLTLLRAGSGAGSA